MRWLAPVLAVWLFGACNASEPSGLPIAGVWGEENLELAVTGTSAELRLPCGLVARFRGPVVPDADGRFQRHGWAPGKFGSGNVEVRLDATLAGELLILELGLRYEYGYESTSRHQLRLGARASYAGLVCPA